MHYCISMFSSILIAGHKQPLLVNWQSHLNSLYPFVKKMPSYLEFQDFLISVLSFDLYQEFLRLEFWDSSALGCDWLLVSLSLFHVIKVQPVHIICTLHSLTLNCFVLFLRQQTVTYSCYLLTVTTKKIYSQYVTYKEYLIQQIKLT